MCLCCGVTLATFLCSVTAVEFETIHTVVLTLYLFGKHCFSHAGPEVGNSLPHVIQEITDANIFKRKLKTFLFEHVFSTL